jgi:hypothetical protein
MVLPLIPAPAAGRTRLMKRRMTSKRTKPMLPRERAEFSAIVDRPPLKLPGHSRLIF